MLLSNISNMPTLAPITDKPTETKTCKICGPELHIMFGPYKEDKSQRKHWRCLKCMRGVRKKYYASNPKREQKRAKDWMDAHPARAKEINHTTYRNRRAKIRTAVLNHYSGNNPRCACLGCSVTEEIFLVIDHINGGGTKHRKELKKSSISFWEWLIDNNYPKGYRVLCHNCNFAYGLYGKCPHQVPDENL